MSLPVTAEPLPTSYAFGKVVGRVIHLIADTDEDTDDKPQARSAAGRVTFVPKDVLRKTADADYPAIVLHASESATLSGSGRVLDAEGRQGIWLAVGVYTVNFEITGVPRGIPAFDINVTTEHTDAAPLDLAKEAPYIPPAGTTVRTVLIPSGGTEGQVLVRDASGGLVWADQAAEVDFTGYATTTALTDGLAGKQPAGSYATPADITTASIADRARANHTGTQVASTISDLTEAIEAVLSTTVRVAFDVDGTPYLTNPGVTP